MKKVTLALSIALASTLLLEGRMIEKTLTYSLGGKTFSGIVTWDDSTKGPLPGIIMIPNWMGPTSQSLEKAQKIAGKDFIVFMVDMYGVDIRPQNMQEASDAATTVRSDRSMMRARVGKAVQEFQQADIPWDKKNMAAIGFCFGGGSVLEYARSGAADVLGVVSFHGNLDTPQPEQSRPRVPMLVLHGADDPFVPAEQVANFHQEVAQTKADCTFVSFSGAVHSFTDPYATMTGKAEYHEPSARRSMAMMRLYLQEWFAGKRDVPIFKESTPIQEKGGLLRVAPGESKRPGSLGKP